jgi:hypothetical protein
MIETDNMTEAEFILDELVHLFSEDPRPIMEDLKRLADEWFYNCTQAGCLRERVQGPLYSVRKVNGLLLLLYDAVGTYKEQERSKEPRRNRDRV